MSRIKKESTWFKNEVISANFTFDKNQLLFNFLADDRVDFRELALENWLQYIVLELSFVK